MPQNTNASVSVSPLSKPSSRVPRKAETYRSNRPSKVKGRGRFKRKQAPVERQLEAERLAAKLDAEINAEFEAGGKLVEVDGKLFMTIPPKAVRKPRVKKVLTTSGKFAASIKDQMGRRNP